GIDSVWLESECARYEFFFDVIQQAPPDVVIISLDANRNKALLVINQLTCEFPDMPILVASSDNKAILQAMERGAKFFLTQPVVLEELLTALRQLASLLTPLRRLAALRPLSKRSGDDGKPVMVNEASLWRCVKTPGSRVIAVLGSRGGVGCT